MAESTSTYEDILPLFVGSWVDETEGKIREHLTFIGDVDLSEPDYSFDLLRIYVRKSDGAILYATDSGCSCPSPFEDTTVADLCETTLGNIVDVARRMADDPDEFHTNPVAQVAGDVTNLLPKMREAGAR